MVLLAPRSAKIVEAQGARFTLMLGYVFVLLGFVTMLVLWKDGVPYWKVGLGVRVRRRRSRARGDTGFAIAHRVGSRAPCGHGVGHRRSPARPRRRDHAVDLRCVAHRRVRVGIREVDCGGPNANEVSDSVQSQLTKSFSSAETTAQQYPQYAKQIIKAAQPHSSTGRTGRTSRGSSRRAGMVLVFFSSFPTPPAALELLEEYARH